MARIPPVSPNGAAKFLNAPPLGSWDDQGEYVPGSEGLQAFDYAVMPVIATGSSLVPLVGLRPVLEYPFDPASVPLPLDASAWPSWLTDRFSLRVMVPQTGNMANVVVELGIYAGFGCQGEPALIAQINYSTVTTAGLMVALVGQVSGLLTHYWEVRGRIVSGPLTRFAIPLRMHTDRAGGPWQVKFGDLTSPSFPLAANTLP